MKKIILSLCFILIIVILNHDYGKAESKKEIINIKKNIDPKLISQFKQDLNSNKIEYDYLNEINLIIIKNDNDISAILEKYKNIISSNGHPSKITSDSLTSDEFKNYNWYLDKIFINNMYQNSKNNYSNIKVGVIDSGVHSNGLNVDKTNSKNYTSEDRINIKDDTGHGTMVANMVNTVAPNVKLSIYK